MKYFGILHWKDGDQIPFTSNPFKNEKEAEKIFGRNFWDDKDVTIDEFVKIVSSAVIRQPNTYRYEGESKRVAGWYRPIGNGQSEAVLLDVTAECAAFTSFSIDGDNWEIVEIHIGEMTEDEKEEEQDQALDDYDKGFNAGVRKASNYLRQISLANPNGIMESISETSNRIGFAKEWHKKIRTFQIK